MLGGRAKHAGPSRTSYDVGCLDATSRRPDERRPPELPPVGGGPLPAKEAGEHPLLLLVGYDLDLLDDKHPLAGVRARTLGQGLAVEVVLADLTADEVG